jgi:hypothetical protein
MVSKERYLNGSGIQMGYGINQNTGLGINNDPIGPPLCPSCDLAVYGNQIIPSQWNHLVGVWDNDSLYLFHNSVLVGRANGALPNDSLLISTMPLLFGKAFTSLTPPYPTNFKGKLDDIGIWNRALDSSEVVQLYNTGICTQTVADCDTLIFDANITGFNPVTYANHVMVYPNPARDNLVIDCGSNYAGLNGYRINRVFTFTTARLTANTPISLWPPLGLTEPTL